MFIWWPSCESMWWWIILAFSIEFVKEPSVKFAFEHVQFDQLSCCRTDPDPTNNILIGFGQVTLIVHKMLNRLEKHFFGSEKRSQESQDQLLKELFSLLYYGNSILLRLWVTRHFCTFFDVKCSWRHSIVPLDPSSFVVAFSDDCTKTLRSSAKLRTCITHYTIPNFCYL